MMPNEILHSAYKETVNTIEIDLRDLITSSNNKKATVIKGRSCS